MLKKPTVLVLGAGAAKPYGFPLGSELRDSVLRSLGHGAPVRKSLIDAGATDHALAQFSEELAHSGFSSVDAFLEQRPQWTDIGKSAMACCLLEQEHVTRSKLFPPDQPGDHWYQALWAKLKSRSWYSFKKQPLSIITFNYDRSLEHYLVQVLCNNYRLRPQTALQGLPVVHVHGTLGSYDDSAYGGSFDIAQLDSALMSIRVVHEADVQHSEFVEARRLLAQTERILFVGFGYLETNMRKLGFAESGKRDSAYRNIEIIGTNRGIPNQSWQRTSLMYGMNQAAVGGISNVIADYIY